MIWMSEAALPRTAVKAQSVMRLPETSTLPARKTLTPLPFSPVPPPSARMRAMRLAETMLPSSPSFRAPHLDAVVAAVGDVVVGDLETRRVDAADGGLDDGGDGAVGDAARAHGKRDAVGGAARERQMAQAHAAELRIETRPWVRPASSA